MGTALMFSMPPAITTWLSPALMDAAASAIAFIPDAHTLLIVMAGVSLGMPARIIACLPGFWPWPAMSTLPIITSSTVMGMFPSGQFQYSCSTGASPLSWSGLGPSFARL